jgi:hypothetical protein
MESIDFNYREEPIKFNNKQDWRGPVSRTMEINWFWIDLKCETKNNNLLVIEKKNNGWNMNKTKRNC